MGHTERGPVVHAICGLVCAGKTTLAKELASELDGVRFTLDEWMLRLFGLRHSGTTIPPTPSDSKAAKGSSGTWPSKSLSSGTP